VGSEGGVLGPHHGLWVVVLGVHCHLWWWALGMSSLCSFIIRRHLLLSMVVGAQLAFIIPFRGNRHGGVPYCIHMKLHCCCEELS